MFDKYISEIIMGWDNFDEQISEMSKSWERSIASLGENYPKRNNSRKRPSTPTKNWEPKSWRIMCDKCDKVDLIVMVGDNRKCSKCQGNSLSSACK